MNNSSNQKLNFSTLPLEQCDDESTHVCNLRYTFLAGQLEILSAVCALGIRNETYFKYDVCYRDDQQGREHYSYLCSCRETHCTPELKDIYIPRDESYYVMYGLRQVTARLENVIKEEIAKLGKN